MRSDSQLGRLTQLLTGSQSIDTSVAETLSSEAFSCHTLCPDSPTTVYDDQVTEIRRWVATADSSETGARRQGVAGFAAVVAQLSDRLGKGQRRAKFKTYRIESSDSDFTTDVLFQASSRNGTTTVQLDASWRCRWSHPSSDPAGRPRLLEILVTRHEEAIIRVEQGRLFDDCTVPLMSGNASYNQHIRIGIDDWLPRLPKLHGIEKLARHGITVGDINGDGLEDLYMPETGGLPNRMYQQNEDGTLTDVSSRSATDWIEPSSAALLIDLDNDGDQDLVIAARPHTLFLENDGTGRFESRSSVRAVADPFSLCAADFDGDADLDIYVCGYNRSDTERGAVFPIPYQDANNGGANALLRNEGGFRFVDVTADVGLDTNNRRFSFAAALGRLR